MMLINLMAALDSCSSEEEMRDILALHEEAKKIRIFPVPGKYFGQPGTVFVIGEEISAGERRPIESFSCLLITETGMHEISGKSGFEYINLVMDRVLENISEDEKNSIN